MLGSTQVDRSNAVGHNPSYLPELNPGMNGGNTYNGSSSDPTIQDYENIFGPSARDIKTDLQRFKRHGRWHLPDALKGANPWLTDRIDGLITDATNSPFTTRILPYLYKENPDGKFTWNVWQFDEGMASRVPYESAARTLTQSKTEFSGYLVRHGMGIVMEHNFMMSPKGRENFKNQLNQLIGSIQYSNDFDVHMALVLAPSYQKTMREKYFTIDKSPSQICREFCDLFGMMQKNVNALDILIEEAKAILKTWNGPMPDFLLCNSKLTFQLTMTPEKTNYTTQGPDGAKRLKQGPDIASYRGLSVIHSRAFSLEAGQQPRDLLRRRVRTGEYYRILPHKDNHLREFEFYTEPRDGWFSLTFQDLLRYAMHRSSEARPEFLGGKVYGGDNHIMLGKVYNEAVADAARKSMGKPLMLGVPGDALSVQLEAREVAFIEQQKGLCQSSVANRLGLQMLYGRGTDTALQILSAPESPGYSWGTRHLSFDMNIHHIPPAARRFPVWKSWGEALVSGGIKDGDVERAMVPFPRLSPSMQASLFTQFKGISLNNPFRSGRRELPMSPGWFASYTFYQEVYRRYGVPFSKFNLGKNPRTELTSLESTYEPVIDQEITQRKLAKGLALTRLKRNVGDNLVDLGQQFLSLRGVTGSVNHELNFLPADWNSGLAKTMTTNGSFGGMVGRSIVMYYEMLEPLLQRYRVHGQVMSGLEYLCNYVRHSMLEDSTKTAFMNILEVNVFFPGTLLEYTYMIQQDMATLIKELITDKLARVDGSISGGEILAELGVSTWPMGVTTRSNLINPGGKYDPDVHDVLLNLSDKTYGHLNLACLNELCQFAQTEVHVITHHFNQRVVRQYSPNFTHIPNNEAEMASNWIIFWNTISDRIITDPATFLDTDKELSVLSPDPLLRPFALISEDIYIDLENLKKNDRPIGVESMADPAALAEVSVDLNQLFRGAERVRTAVKTTEDKESLSDQVEIVVIRPNIEHNMLGIIMGLAGSELGYTLWGQTELSCYDDSMHGIWGMSYKYHERAIVFNTRNLVRLWDIAYDGYNGGKDDTYVDWMNPSNPKNGVDAFREATLDLSRGYRGPSMMVMAFVHHRNEMGKDGRPVFDSYFRRNWPSPIAFHDMYDTTRAAAPTNETLPLDQENIQVVDVQDFRVFNNPLYEHSYAEYRDMMPAFHELHKMRKTAGESSSGAETQTDSLAFQGSMRIKQNGVVVQEIQGSGHHGPDYVGVASVRAGKGIKYNGMAPALTHMV